jgi:hypothetical protein
MMGAATAALLWQLLATLPLIQAVAVHQPAALPLLWQTQPLATAAAACCCFTLSGTAAANSRTQQARWL